MKRVLCGVALLALAGCAEDPSKSYAAAKSAQDCRTFYEREVRQWRSAVTTPQERKQRDTWVEFANSLGIASGEALFQGRLKVCLTRIKSRPAVLRQPGTAGKPRVYTCRDGGGVFQGGSAICPGY